MKKQIKIALEFVERETETEKGALRERRVSNSTDA